jgi:small-conductance mechanosensitive channel
MQDSAQPTTENAPAPADADVSPVVDTLAVWYNRASDIWNMDLFKLQDTTISVSQIVIAIITLLVGIILAKILSKRVAKTFLPRFHIEPGPASAIQTVLFYVLITAVAILSLQIAGVPLTVFTIFGGAVAIGVGFGSQNVVNNFISGLIILMERPIQVGDLIEVQGEIGMVQKIGARATHLTNYKGITSVVPNSIILENRVGNYFLPDRTMRAIISVGVAYGSDIQLVKKVLESILEDHVRVLEHPENRVLFMNFGDSSLDFEVHFMIMPRNSLDRRQIESDLRFKIDELFRENNITIPFPQRDINFKPSPPIQIVTQSGAQGQDGSQS